MTAQYLENSDGKLTGSPATAIEEDEFVIAAKGGDTVAFDVLCKQSANMLFNVARRMMRSNEDAEDVVQESFQQAFIHLKSFKGDSRFSTWLCRIATNAALMRLRKPHVWREISLDESADTKQLLSWLDIEDQRSNPEEHYAQKEHQQILSAAINELRPGMRRAIELRELDERSTQEAARIMGISCSAVKARVFQGRRKLLTKLNSKLRKNLNERFSAA